MHEALLDAGSAPYGVAPSSLLNKVEQAVFGVFHVSGCRRWAVSRPPPLPPSCCKKRFAVFRRSHRCFRWFRVYIVWNVYVCVCVCQVMTV